jgi:hypothetical protein
MNKSNSMTPVALKRTHDISIEIGKILADEPQWFVDAFHMVARRELVECCDSIRHPGIVQQVDTIDRALDTIDRTRREIIRSRSN